MKRYIVLILGFLVSQMAWGQEAEIVVTPVLSTTSIDSIKTRVGSTIIYAPDSSFLGITAGMHVYGLGIAANTTVLTVTSDDSLVLSVAATRKDTVAVGHALQFEKATALPYSVGDWLGLPFTIYENLQATPKQLKSIVATDAVDTLGIFDIVFFSSWSDTLGADNAASAVYAADAHKVAGYHAFATAPTDFGTTRVLFKDNIDIVLPGGKLYGRMIARIAQHVGAVSNPYRLKFRFK